MPGNGRGAQTGAPTVTSTYDAASVPRCRDEVESLRAAITRSLDCFELGDCAAAAEVLLAADEGAPVDAPARCRWCTFSGWPGRVEAHELSAHPWDLVLVDAA